MTSVLSAHLNDENRLWFPGLADDLVANFCRDQGRRTLADEYGTQQWLTGGVQTPVVEAVTIGRYIANVEYLPDAIAATFDWLTFAGSKRPFVREQIQASADLLLDIHGLADTVGRIVRSIHPLHALRDHDVSHSSPDLPFSVFVSVPDPGERDGLLRVAESLIHESMHLQLTLIDSIDPLVVEHLASDYSPWKEEIRPVAGLLHGLYVFAVIHQTLGTLMYMRADFQQYCTKRRTAIQREVATLPEEPDGLSATGRQLWRRGRETVLV